MKSAKRPIKFALLAAALSASLWSTAQAGTCALIPSDVADMEDTERVELLEQFKFAELDNLLTKQARKRLSQPGGDLLTLREIIYLQSRAGSDGKLLRMWLDERPQSFFAQYNMGLFYGLRAFSARGTEAANKVSAAQIREVKKNSDVAVGYFQKAISLEPQFSLPYASLIGLAGIQGRAGERDAAQWLEAANQAIPKNVAARLQAISFLTPRYGVSYEFLDRMVAQAEKSLPSDAANYLKYNLVLEKANHFEVIERNKAQALALYKQARSMCDNSEVARAGIVRNY
ncbi:DUF4034 domain-containing protein [Diaphorobacter aerolatus]|uniref:DUF4034 domain-containing protein n=1 Tax=Diaphorobacter aerolatus TaxID=1288495 RepID=A0A7H0GL56_9BURK|nr:DUF4034 domain-containing protein [Diaphorobacter aerolatus]QNP49022.1 DUF4034 domain-containing protein [Diaphorobacter aerolatus]